MSVQLEQHGFPYNPNFCSCNVWPVLEFTNLNHSEGAMEAEAKLAVPHPDLDPCCRKYKFCDIFSPIHHQPHTSTVY